LQASFDASWQRDALAGRDGAVKQLADAAMKPLYRFCLYRVGGNHHLCEEVVQETLLSAIRRLGRYDPRRSGGSIFPWLTGLARNEIRRVLAREKAVELARFWRRMDRRLLRLYAALESEPFGDDLLARAETREMVNATMAQLPPHYGRALEAKYVLGKSVREIAAGLDTSAKAVESLLTRARKAFRAAFLALANNLPVEGAM
jgi:RNA polymerase sigma-70 factor (ECF subfamily)